MTGDGSFFPDPPGSQPTYHSPKSVISYHPVLEFNGNRNDFWLLFDDGDILEKHKSRPLKKPLKPSDAGASTSKPGFANTFTETTSKGGFLKPKDDDDDVSKKSVVGKKKFADKCELSDDHKESRKETFRERKRSDSREKRRSRSRDRDRRRSRSPPRRRSPVRDRRYGDRSDRDRRRSRSRDRKRSRSSRDRSRSRDRIRRQARDRRTSPNRGRRSMSISSSSSDGDSKSSKDKSEILKKFAEKLQEKALLSNPTNKSLTSIRLNSRLEDTKHRRGVPVTPIVFSLKKVPVKTLPGSAIAQKAEETADVEPLKEKAPEPVNVEVSTVGSSVNTPLTSNIKFSVPPPLITPHPVSTSQPMRVTDGVTVACAPTLYKGGKQIPVSSSVMSLPPPPVVASAVNPSHPTNSQPMEAPKISEMHQTLAAQALEYATLPKIQEGIIPMVQPGMRVPGLMGPGPGMMAPNHYGPMGPPPHATEAPFIPSFGPEGPFINPPPHGPGGPFMGLPPGPGGPFMRPPSGPDGSFMVPPPGPDGPFLGPPRGPDGPFLGPPPGPDGPFLGPPRGPDGPFLGPPPPWQEGPFLGPPPCGPRGPFMTPPPGGLGMQNPPPFFGPRGGPVGPPPRPPGSQTINSNASVSVLEKGPVNVTSSATINTSTKAENPTTPPSVVEKDKTTSPSNKPPPKPSHVGLEIANYQTIKPIVGVIKRLQYGKRYEHKSKSETSDYCLKRGILCRVNQDLENPALVIVAPDDRSCRRRIVTALVEEYPDMDADALIELFENSFHDMPMEDIEDVFEYESSKRREKLKSKSSSQSKEQSKKEVADTNKPEELSTKVSSVSVGQSTSSLIADKVNYTPTEDKSGSSKADNSPSQTGPPSLEIPNFEKLKFVVGLIKFLQTRSHLNDQIKSLEKFPSDEYCIKDGLLCRVKNESKKQVLVVVPEDGNVRKTIVTAFVLKYPDLDVDGLIELFENTFYNMPMEDIEDVYENESTRRSSLLDSVESDFSKVESISSCGNVVLLCEGELGSDDKAKSTTDPSKGRGEPTSKEDLFALAVTELKTTEEILPDCAVSDTVETSKLAEKSVNDSDKILMPENLISKDKEKIDESTLGIAGDVASSQAPLAESSADGKENEGSSLNNPSVANYGSLEDQKSVADEAINDDASKVETESASSSHLPKDIQEPEHQATQQTGSVRECGNVVSESEISAKNILEADVINEKSNVETSIVTAGGVVMEKSSDSITKLVEKSSSEDAAGLSAPMEGYESVRPTMDQEVVDSENPERLNLETAATDSNAFKNESTDSANDKPEISAEAASTALQPQLCEEAAHVETVQSISGSNKCDDGKGEKVDKLAEISSGETTALTEGPTTSTEHGIMIVSVASLKVGNEADANADPKVVSTQSETTVVKGDAKQQKLEVQGVMSVSDKPEIASEAVSTAVQPLKCEETQQVETTQKGDGSLQLIDGSTKCDDNGETIDAATTALEEWPKTSTDHGIVIVSVASQKVGNETDANSETTLVKDDNEQVMLGVQGVNSDETPSEIITSCNTNDAFKLAESESSQMRPLDSKEVEDEAKRGSEAPAAAGSKPEDGIGKLEEPILIDKTENSIAVSKIEPRVSEASGKSVVSEAVDTALVLQGIKTELTEAPSSEQLAVLTGDFAVKPEPDMEVETDEFTAVKTEPYTMEVDVSAVVKSESKMFTEPLSSNMDIPPLAEPINFEDKDKVTKVKIEPSTAEVDVSESIITTTIEIPQTVEVPPQAKPRKFKSTYELMKSMDFEPKEIYSEPDTFTIVNYDKLSFFATRLIEIQKDSDIASVTSKILFVSFDVSDQFVMKNGLLCKRKDLKTNEVFIVLLKSTAVYREIVSALTEQYPDLDFNEFMSLMASSFLYITPAEIKSLIENIDGKATSIKYQSFIERCKLVNHDIIGNVLEQLKAMQKADSAIMHRYNRLKSNNCVDDSYILKLDLVCQFNGTIDFKVCLPKSQPDQIAIMYIVHESNHNKNLIEFLELLRATFDGVNVSLIDQSVALCSTCHPPATARASSIIKVCEPKCPALKSLPAEVIFKIRQVQMASSVYKAQIELLTKGQSRQGGRYILDSSLLCKAMTKGEELVYRVVVSPSSLKDVVSLLHTTYHRKTLSEFVPFVNEFLAVTELVCKAAIQECNICAKKTLKNSSDARKSPSPNKSHDEASKIKSPEPSKKEKVSSKDKSRTSLKKETEMKKPAITKKDSNESKSTKDSSQTKSSREALKESSKELAKSSRSESSKETIKDSSKRESSRESTKAGSKKEQSREFSTKAGSKRDFSKESKTPEPEKSKTKEHEVKSSETAKTARSEKIRKAVYRDLWKFERLWSSTVTNRIKVILRSIPDKVLSDVVDRQKSCPVLSEIRKDAERSRPSSEAKTFVCGDIVFSKIKATPKITVKPIKNINYILITQIHAEAHDWSISKIVGMISNTFDVSPSSEEIEATIEWFCTKCQKPGISKLQKTYSSLDERLQDFYHWLRTKDNTNKVTPSKSGLASNEPESETKTETDEISKKIVEDLKVLGSVWGPDLVNKIIAAVQPIPYKLRKEIINRQLECVELVNIIESLETKTPEKDARHVFCGGILFVVKSKKKSMLVKIHVKPIGSKNINYVLITQMHAAYHDWSFNRISTVIGASFDVSPSVVEIAVTVEWFCSNCQKPDKASKKWSSLGDQLKDFYSSVDPLLLKEKSKEDDEDDDDRDIDLTQEIPMTDVRIALAKLPNPVVSKIQIAQMASQVLKTQIVLLEKNEGPAKGKGYCLVMSLLCKLVKLDDKLAWRVMIPMDMLEDLVVELHTVHYHDMIQEDFFEFVSSFMTVSEDLVNEVFATCPLCMTTIRRAPTLCERGINEDLVRKTLAMIAEMIDFVIKWQTETPAIAKIREGVKKGRQEAIADYILYKDILFKVSGKSKGGKPPRPKIAVSLLPNALDEVIKSTHAFYHSNNQNQLMNLINVCFDVTVPRNVLSTKIPELCKICAKKSDAQNEDDGKSLGDAKSAGESITDTGDDGRKLNVRESPGANIAGASMSNQPEPEVKTEGEEPTPLGVLLLGRLCDQVIEESSNSSRALDSPVPEVLQTDTRPVVCQVAKIILKRCQYDPKILQKVDEGTTRKRKTGTKKPPAKRARKIKLTKVKEEAASASEDSASDSESSLPKRKFVVYSSESETDSIPTKSRKRKAS